MIFCIWWPKRAVTHQTKPNPRYWLNSKVDWCLQSCLATSLMEEKFWIQSHEKNKKQEVILCSLPRAIMAKQSLQILTEKNVKRLLIFWRNVAFRDFCFFRKALNAYWELSLDLKIFSIKWPEKAVKCQTKPKILIKYQGRLMFLVLFSYQSNW